MSTLPAALQGLRIPMIAAPLFIISVPELVIAQCKAGIVGSFPSLNARPIEMLDQWLTQIKTELEDLSLKYTEPEVYRDIILKVKADGF